MIKMEISLANFFFFGYTDEDFKLVILEILHNITATFGSRSRTSPLIFLCYFCNNSDSLCTPPFFPVVLKPQFSN